MSWAPYILGQRVNAVILFIGAFLIMGAIKLTALLLPEQYYFRFSSLVSSEASPFIVEPPGVTYAKLCDLIRINRMSNARFSASLDCGTLNLKVEDSYGKSNEDEIFRVVFANDEALRKTFSSAAQAVALTPLGEAEVRQLAGESRNVSEALEAVKGKYREQILQQLREASAEPLARMFAALPEADDSADEEGPAADDEGLTEQARDLLLVGHAAAVPRLRASLLEQPLAPITKDALDQIIRFAYSREGLILSVADYYAQQVAQREDAAVETAMRKSGLDLEADKRAVDRAMLSEGVGAYAIAAFIRIAPVLLFGLVVGLVFGPAEVLSASLAAGLAAFLLAWPVILMWDRVVAAGWQDKRAIFFAFYALYVLCFVVTARLGAILGSRLRTHVPENWRGWMVQPPAAGAAEAGMSYSIARDVMATALVNGTFYVTNALASSFTST